VDYGKTASNLGQSFSDAPLATAYGIVSGSKEVFKDRVDTQGVDLSDDAFEVIAKQAENDAVWSKQYNPQGVTRGSYEEWMATGRAIRDANHDRRKISAALKKWEQGDSGRSKDVARLAGDAGVAFDFPDAIASERPIYDQLIFANPIPDALDAGDPAAVKDRLEAIGERLKKLDDSLGSHATAIDPKTFVEMERRIGARKKEIRLQLFNLANPSQGIRQGVSAAGAGRVLTRVGNAAVDAKKGATPTVEDKKEDTPAPAPDPEAAAAEQRKKDFAIAERKQEAEDIVGRISKYKLTEASVFANVQAELDSFWGANVVKCINEENRIRYAYPDWDKDVKRLRVLLNEAGADASEADKYAPNRQHYLELDRKIPGHGYGSGLPGYEEV